VLGSLWRCFAYLFFCRVRSALFVTYGSIIVAGAIAASLVVEEMPPYLKDVARGYPYYPVEGNMITDLSASRQFILSVVWLSATIAAAAAAAYRERTFECLNVLRLLQSTSASLSERPPKTFTPVSPRDQALDISDAYNMFNPADLPPRLAEYANMVYSACEDLGNFFGFQDSSVRNQAEHLLILLSNNRRYMSSHILPPSVQPPSPIHALHAKVFSNYVKWCRAMGVAPHFSKMNTSMNAPPAVASRVVDLVLYFCIWGEGANLRHMSECIWFLYHKLMEEHIQSEGYTQTRSLYAGHFLDHVITPMFEVIQKVRLQFHQVVVS